MENIARRGRGRLGGAAVEAALVLPLVVVAAVGVVDGGRYLLLRQSLDNAVREGARLAIISPRTLTTADIQSAVAGRLDRTVFPNLVVQVYRAYPATGEKLGEWTEALWGDCIAVQATADYPSLIPTFSLLPQGSTISATCMMYCEGN